MVDNIDGTPVADNAGTGAAPDTTPTTPASDTVGRGAEDRIAGLVAERERFKAAAEKAEADRAALEEKYKSDDEKRLDQLVQQRVESEYGPAKQRLERIEAELTTKRDRLLENLPEGSRDCYDSTAPVEVQVRQIELVASHLSTPGAPALVGVNSGGNPPAPAPKDTRRYSLQEYQQVQRWATTDPDKFDEVWPAMKVALVEGRIEGVKPGGIQTR
jgi:hypothetical protein